MTTLPTHWLDTGPDTDMSTQFHFHDNSRTSSGISIPRLGKRFLCALLSALLLTAFPGTRLAAESETESAPVRIVFFGDSLTAGYGLSPEEAFPALVGEMLESRGFEVHTVNAGLSGETSAGGVQRADWVFRQPMDVLVLALGANDGLRGLPPADTTENLRAIIERARSRHPDVRILLAGMLAPPNMGPDYQRAFAGIYPAVAKSEKVAVMPFLLENVAGEPELNQPDGIHPTAAGQEIIARNLIEYLLPLVRSAASGADTPPAGQVRGEQNKG